MLNPVTPKQRCECEPVRALSVLARSTYVLSLKRWSQKRSLLRGISEKEMYTYQPYVHGQAHLTDENRMVKA